MSYPTYNEAIAEIEDLRAALAQRDEALARAQAEIERQSLEIRHGRSVTNHESVADELRAELAAMRRERDEAPVAWARWHNGLLHIVSMIEGAYDCHERVMILRVPEVSK